METKRVYSDANRAAQRSYRPVQPSDLPQIQSGKLKAFYSGGLKATLMSVRFGQIHTELWLIENKDYDQYCIGISNIVVDVTPEKRYAVWSHNIQRFLYTNNDAGFTSKGVAESFIGDHQKCYVVEWEIKNND